MKRGMNIKGAIPWTKVIIVVLILAVLYLTFGVKYLHIGQDCNVTKEDFEAYNKSGSFGKFFSTTGWKLNFYGCDVEEGFLKGLVTKTKGFLGFNQGFWDFWPDLVTGALIGLWFVIVLKIASFESKFKLTRKSKRYQEAKYKRLRSSWLGLLGDGIWKIIPVAVLYAVLMQIPIINTAVEIISFKQLFYLKNSPEIWNWLIRSFILAFYFGFLPAGIETITRYNIRKRYYEAVVRAKFRSRGMDAVGAP